MAIGTFIKLKSEFTDNSIPRLYRDGAITPGTLFCYDTGDEFSWPRQGAAVNGDSLISLKDGTPAGVFVNDVGWNAGTKTLDFASGAGYANLPPEGIPPATADAFVVIVWAAFGATGADTNRSILTAGSDFTSSNPYGFLEVMQGGVNYIRLQADGKTVRTVNNAEVGRMYQLAIGYKKRTDGKYDITGYINGVAENTVVSTGTSIQLPGTYTQPRLGSGANGRFKGRIGRVLVDSSATKTAAAIVAADYEQNKLRIV